jgi:hypothetical protein
MSRSSKESHMSIERSVMNTGDAKWQQSLSNLLEWLETQKGGIATFYEFQRRSLALRADNEEHAALLRLLADLSGRFADLYDGEPLDLATASRALAVLTDHVRQAAGLEPEQAGHVLDLLNRIGLAELAPPE